MIKDATEIQDKTKMFPQSRCTQDQMKIYLELDQNKRMTKQKEKGTSQCLQKKAYRQQQFLGLIDFYVVIDKGIQAIKEGITIF